MWFRRVVFPEPKKPVNTVTGTLLILLLSRFDIINDSTKDFMRPPYTLHCITTQNLWILTDLYDDYYYSSVAFLSLFTP